MTEWREVVGYEGLYRVSEHGEVIGVIRKKIKKQFPNTREGLKKTSRIW
ncbi:NUMOD4 domain-containing protein [Pseudomonas aeruginosa]